MIMATTRPNSVVSSAMEIPPATTAGEISLAALMSSKAWIIPATVPVNPSMGASVTTVLSQTMFFSRKAISMVPAFSIPFSTASIPRCDRLSPAWNISATGPRVLEHTSTALSRPSS